MIRSFITLSFFLLLLSASVAWAQPTPPQFDHNSCQYPDRWSNPPNGCDNSDPAVPECIKSMSTHESEQACIKSFEQNSYTPQALPSVGGSAK